MAKMYTLDSKLLTGTPEIRVGDKVYPVDDRQKTVKKILDICDKNAEKKDLDMIDEVFKLAFAPKDYKEIEAMNMPWAAHQQLFTLAISAVTGEDAEKTEARFPQETQSKFEESWYDLDYDRELIIQSIAKQYNILPSEQENLHYSDWYRLVAGLMHDTPLGQIVRIRSEDNKDIIKNFDRYEKQIRSEWTAFRNQKARETFTEQDKLETVRYFERLFKGMFGKAGDK